MCLCPCLQNALCNASGSPHSDLFPVNNGTLEVDIYKGVCLFIITITINPHSGKSDSQTVKMCLE